jgi:hypothetical protein
MEPKSPGINLTSLAGGLLKSGTLGEQVFAFNEDLLVKALNRIVTVKVCDATSV